jgi:hypothetical protein
MSTNEEVKVRDFENGLKEVTDVFDKEVSAPLIKAGDEKKRKEKEENDRLATLVTKGMEISFKEKELNEKVKLSSIKEENDVRLKEEELRLKELEIENHKRELEDEKVYREMDAALKERELDLKEKEIELEKDNVKSENFKTAGSLVEKVIMSAGTIISAGALYKTVIDGVRFVYKHDQDEVISKSAFDFLRMMAGFIKRS